MPQPFSKPAGRIVVTGANGFVGRHLCSAFAAQGTETVGLVRRLEHHPACTEQIAAGDLLNASHLKSQLEGAHAVVHLAAVTHSADNNTPSALANFRDTNVGATIELARAALAVGVQHFVFMSSIKVNGECTRDVAGRAQRFSSTDTPQPEDNYGRSKWDAEVALNEMFANSSAELTILRPPLVYGPGNKGNFPRLMRWVTSPWPLPLAAINNRRSLIYVNNLADAVVLAATRRYGGGTFTLADVDLSTPELIQQLAIALAVQPRLITLPLGLLRNACLLARRGAEWERLCGSLQVDSVAIGASLGWAPRIGVGSAMRATAAWYLDTRR